MKKFHFELEEILSIRKFQEQQAEAELAKALAVEKQIQDELDTLAKRQILMGQQLKGTTNFSDIVNATNFSEYVRKRSEVLMENMAQAKIISEQKRELVRKAMQKVESLESLKETQYKEYKLAVQKEEDEEVDDIIMSKRG